MSTVSLFTQYETDHAKEQNGVWVYPTGIEDDSAPAFLIARMGPMNQKYQKTLERVTRPYKRLLAMNALPNEKADEIMQQVFVQSILLDWRNVTDKSGKTVSFSAENAMTFFKLLPDLYFELQQQAQTASLFRVDEAEAVAKNS